MRYNKEMPLYYRVNTTAGPVVKATMIGVMQEARKDNAKTCYVESVQKIDGEWVKVEGHSKAIVNGMIDCF